MPYSLAEPGAKLLLNWVTGKSVVQPTAFQIRLMVTNGNMSSPGFEVTGGTYAPQTVAFADAIDASGIIRALSENSVTWASLHPTENTIITGAELWATAPTPLRLAWTEHTPYSVPAGTGTSYAAGDLSVSMTNDFTSGQGSNSTIGFDKTFRFKMLDWLLGRAGVAAPTLPLTVTLIDTQDVAYDDYEAPHPGDLWTEEEVLFSVAMIDGDSVVAVNNNAVVFEGLDSSTPGSVGAFEIWDSAGSSARIGVVNTIGHPMLSAPSIPADTSFQIPAGYLKLKIV